MFIFVFIRGAKISKNDGFNLISTTTTTNFSQKYLLSFEEKKVTSLFDLSNNTSDAGLGMFVNYVEMNQVSKTFTSIFVFKNHLKKLFRPSG